MMTYSGIIRYTGLGMMALLLMFSSAVSQPRIGYLNPQDVLDELPQKTEIERELNEFLDQRENEFQEKASEFQARLAEYQQQQPNMTDEQIQQEEQRLGVMNQELETLQFEIEQEFQQRQSRLLQPVLNEINVAIETVAAEMQLDYVLNEATGEGELILVFVSSEGKENFNITQKVLNLMLN